MAGPASRGIGEQPLGTWPRQPEPRGTGASTGPWGFALLPVMGNVGSVASTCDSHGPKLATRDSKLSCPPAFGRGTESGSDAEKPGGDGPKMRGRHVAPPAGASGSTRFVPWDGGARDGPGEDCDTSVVATWPRQPEPRGPGATTKPETGGGCTRWLEKLAGCGFTRRTTGPTPTCAESRCGAAAAVSAPPHHMWSAWLTPR